MKKVFYIIVPLFLATACQDELYEKPLEEFVSAQSVYLKNSGGMQIFAEEDQTITIDEVKIDLVNKENKKYNVKMKFGSAEQLEQYNKKTGSNYVVLPADMYEAPTDLTFNENYTELSVPLKIKSLKFSNEGTYALPIQIESSDAGVIEAQSETMLVIEPRIRAKVLKISGYGTEDANMYNGTAMEVDQWTFEAMVRRSQYNSNNKSIGGTKANSYGPLHEIFTRFGDVTIDPNQLQIKTGGSQIDIPKDKLAAKPNEWYMLTFVYDGNLTKVYVNGVLAASREIRQGTYKFDGFWVGGANEYIREYRFWKTARTEKQIKDHVWKMVNPSDENLVVYYPMNGKKRDKNTGEITNDESKIWDWSNNEKHLNLPSQGSSFDNNSGAGFVFPPEA